MVCAIRNSEIQNWGACDVNRTGFSIGNIGVSDGSRSGVDRAQPAMRHGTAHNGGMPLRGSYEVVNILAAPAQEPQILDAFDPAADEGVNAFHEDC